MVNLNRENFNVGSYPYGETQNIEAKMGRKKYYIDVTKDVNKTYLSFYRKLATKRNKMSKYCCDAELTQVTVKNDAVLDRTFFLRMKEIEKAQQIFTRFNPILI